MLKASCHYVLSIALFLSCLSPLWGAYAAGEYIPGEILIETQTFIPEFEARTQGTPLPSSLRGMSRLQSVKRINHRPKGPSIQSIAPQTYRYKLSFPDSENLTLQCDALMQNNGIRIAQPNFIYSTQFVPNDTLYTNNQRSYMNFIKAEDAWDISRGTSNVTIAIIDTGAFLTHEDVKNQFWTNPGEIANNLIDDDLNGYVDDTLGFDFVNNDKTPNDDNGHGTHVAGIAAAQTNNSTGIAGICHNCDIMVLKAGTSSGLFSTQDLLDSIDYAVDNDADIINMSLGGTFSSGSDTLLANKVATALSAGIYVVAAAGNNQANTDTTRFRPASFPGVLTVSGADIDGTFAESWGGGFGSNFGNSIDIMAPGTNILSSDISGQTTNTYLLRDGTSMAAPIISGALALILSVNPTISTSNAYKALTKGATDKETAGFDIKSGYGLLDIEESLLIAQDTTPPSISVSSETEANIQAGYILTAEISDDGPNAKQSNIPTATVYYRYIYPNVAAGAFTAVTMTRSDSTFTASIPSPNGIPEGYHYYVEAMDILDQTSLSPSNAPTGFHSVSIEDKTSPNVTFRHSENDVLPAIVRVALTDNLSISINSLTVVLSSGNQTTVTHRITDINSILSFSNNTLSIDLSTFSFDVGTTITLEVAVQDEAGLSASSSLSFIGPQESLKLFGPNGQDSPLVAVPNPFNPTTTDTTLWFQSTKDAEVSISIYSLNLQLVKKIEGPASAGPVTSFTWNGCDESGRIVPNGVYIAAITATSDGQTINKRIKIALLR